MGRDGLGRGPLFLVRTMTPWRVERTCLGGKWPRVSSPGPLASDKLIRPLRLPAPALADLALGLAGVGFAIDGEEVILQVGPTLTLSQGFEGVGQDHLAEG